MKDVFVDIVDDHDNIIMIRPLSRVVEDGLVGQLRMIKLLIINFDKELLLCRTLNFTQNNQEKNKEQALFDVPLTAIVHAGETYEQALLRVCQELFGLDLIDLPYHELGTLSRQDGMDCFTQVFQLTYNQLPDFSATKFNDFMWEKPLNIITQFAQESLGEKSLSICLKSFYFDCTDSLSC